jgi:DNA-binding NarL/FixJ family response regulator
VCGEAEGHRNALERLEGTDADLVIVDISPKDGNGLTTRKIADQLGLSVKTVDSHRENIEAKLGAGSLAELVRHAVLWVLAES